MALNSGPNKLLILLFLDCLVTGIRLAEIAQCDNSHDHNVIITVITVMETSGLVHL
jgi:hypothetical protein